jgi:phosphoglycerate dehydrogenase-like enzyme
MSHRHPFFVVIVPPEGGMLEVDGSKRHAHGGKPYRDLAESVLAPHGEIAYLEWMPSSLPEGGAEELEGLLAEADALVIAPWLIVTGLDLQAFDEARFQRAPDLKVIAGTHDYRLGWIDLEAADRRGVAVVDTSRSMTPTVAEYGVAMTLALLRDIPGAVDIVRRGGWIHGMQGDGRVFRDLADCRVGLAGYGSINRHYRSYIGPYGCEVKTYDPFVGEDLLAADNVGRASSLVELAATSDVLVVAIPPTPATLRVVDANVIDALAPGSLFVLLSRMAVVEQEALWRRVRLGELWAALDVYEPEPPPEDAWFRQAPNVLPTPHIAGNVDFAHLRCFGEACHDAVRVVNGDAPLYAASVRDKELYDGTLASDPPR